MGTEQQRHFPVAGPRLFVYKTTLTFSLDINLILQKCLPKKPPLIKHVCTFANGCIYLRSGSEAPQRLSPEMIFLA